MGPKLGSVRVIEEGLQPGSRIIVNGLLRARPALVNLGARYGSLDDLLFVLGGPRAPA